MTTDTETTDPFEFNLPAGKVLQILRSYKENLANFKPAREKILSPYLMAIFVSIVLTGATIFFTPFATPTILAFNIAGLMVSGIINGLVENARGEDGLGKVIFCFLLFVPFVWMLFSLVYEPLHFVCGFLSGFSLLSIVRYFDLRTRLQMVEPQAFELQWLIRVLKPIADDLPKKMKCRIRLNPFSSEWSLNETDFWQEDEMLSFVTQPEAASVLGVSVIHRQRNKMSSSGKHKGYRNRFSYRFFYKHPILEGLSEGNRIELQNELTKLVKQHSPESTRNDEYCWRRISSAQKFSVKVDHQKVSVVLGTKEKNWKSEMGPDDIFHPASILAVLKFMTSVVGSINFGPAGGEPPPVPGA